MKYFTVLCRILLVGSCLFQNETYAATRCEQAFRAAETPIVNKFPKLEQIPLPATMVSAIKKHPIWQTTADLRDLPVTFDVLMQSGRGEDYEKNPRYIGEYLQSLFLKKIVRVLFPKANFDLAADRSQKYKFKLDIRDPAEFKEMKRETEPTYLSMLPLKKANHSYSSLQREEMREAFGFSSSDRVAHIYTSDHSPLLEGPDSVLQLILLTRKNGFKKIIFSPNPRSSRERLEAFLDHLSPLPTVRMSSLKASDVKQSTDLIILNDTSGNMPFLYMASDLAIVHGPINPIEAPAMGVKTLINIGHVGMDNYGLDNYMSLVEVAQKTQRAYPFHGARELQKVIETADLDHSPFVPLESFQGDEISDFDNLLDLIEKKLIAQRKRINLEAKLPDLMNLKNSENPSDILKYVSSGQVAADLGNVGLFSIKDFENDLRKIIFYRRDLSFDIRKQAFFEMIKINPDLTEYEAKQCFKHFNEPERLQIYLEIRDWLNPSDKQKNLLDSLKSLIDGDSHK